MTKGVWRTLIWISGFIALVTGLFLANFLASRSALSTEEARLLGFYSFDAPREVAPFSLTDHEGKVASNESLRGHWSLLFFGFTHCPDICPTTLSVLNEAVRKLEKPPQVWMVSVDPERDTPSTLATYVPGFNPGFRGITGEFDQIVVLAKGLNIAFGKVPGPEPGTYQVDHSASIVVVNPQGEYAGFIKAPHNAQNIRKIVSAFH